MDSNFGILFVEKSSKKLKFLKYFSYEIAKTKNRSFPISKNIDRLTAKKTRYKPKPKNFSKKLQFLKDFSYEIASTENGYFRSTPLQS